MLNFEQAMEKIKSISQEELQKMIYTALDQSGIQYEKGDGKIIYDGLPSLSFEDIYYSENTDFESDRSPIAVSLHVLSDNEESVYYQRKSNMGNLRHINIQEENTVPTHDYENMLLAV
jgi:hypothetical protein